MLSLLRPKPKYMNNNLPFFIRLSLSVLVLFCLSGCTSDPDNVNFLLNEQDLASIAEMPSDPNDSLKVLRVMVGDSIFFKDVSSPASSVKSRLWDLNGDNSWEPESGEFTHWVYEQPGYIKIVLCINGDENCVGKWIFVEEAAAPISIEEPMPTPDPLLPPVRTPTPSRPKPIVAKPPQTEVPEPAPVKPPPPARLTKTGYSGGPLKQRVPTAFCIDLATNSFTVTIKPKQDVELQAFYLYTDKCGGMKINFTGGDIAENFTVPLNQGRNDVKLGEIGDRLQPGITYTMTCTAFGNYAGCAAGVPRFENAVGCSKIKPYDTSVLNLDQQGHLIIFDLKFLY